MKITKTITAIPNGKHGCMECPVAEAMIKAFNLPEDAIRVGRMYMEADGFKQRYHTRAMRTWISRYDCIKLLTHDGAIPGSGNCTRASHQAVVKAARFQVTLETV